MKQISEETIRAHLTSLIRQANGKPLMLGHKTRYVLMMTGNSVSEGRLYAQVSKQISKIVL